VGKTDEVESRVIRFVGRYPETGFLFQRSRSGWQRIPKGGACGGGL